MRAEGFTRWDAFLRFNSPPRKQVNPLMTQEQEQQLSQTMLAMMQSGGDAPKSTVEVPVYAWRLIRWEADVPLTEEQRQEALDKLPETLEALKNENEMLKQCLLEMSETVYA